MRVVGGEFKKMKLQMVDSKLTRPTTDKVKEAIFSIINPYIKEGGTAIDLYAGSGSLGIEAVSRGYGHAYLIDNSRLAINTIKKNIENTKHAEEFTVIKQKASNAVSIIEPSVKFDLILFDPPYAKQQILSDLENLREQGRINDDAIIVAETDEHGFNSINQNVDKNHFEIITRKEYGITFLTILRSL